jgi:hypothetical protein
MTYIKTWTYGLGTQVLRDTGPDVLKPQGLSREKPGRMGSLHIFPTVHVKGKFPP